MKTLKLSGKTAVITGAGQGVGLETARIMAAKDAHIHALDVDASNLSALKAELGNHVTTHLCDISNEDAVDAAFAGIPQVHVLVNNAGIQRESGFEGIDLRDWRRTIDVNLTGTFLCIRAALPRMERNSTILNVLTHTGRRTNLYPYAASKAAIHNLTENLAIELGPRGISINGLAFGAIFSERNAAWQNDPQKVQAAKDRTPLGFMLEAADIAGQLVSFVEHSSLYATGTIFDVSGGRSLR